MNYKSQFKIKVPKTFKAKFTKLPAQKTNLFKVKSPKFSTPKSARDSFKPPLMPKIKENNLLGKISKF